MKTVVLQSNYIPWRGYFQLISAADNCIFYDDVQFTKNDWRNRNKILGPRGSEWITIPVGANINRKIDEVQLPDNNWKEKHHRRILANYKKAECIESLIPLLNFMYITNQSKTLSDYNQEIISEISRNYLGLNTMFSKSNLYKLNGSGANRLQDLLLQSGTIEYITGPAGLNYLSPLWFEENQIKLTVFNYGNFPKYAQLFDGNEPNVSIIDLIANVGKESPSFFRGEN